MCGRFTLTAPGEEIASLFELSQTPRDLQPRYNIAPSQPAPVVYDNRDRGERIFAHFYWGLVPFWADDPRVGARMINARSETAAQRPAFRAAMRYRRCLVVADGFYEWRSEGAGKRKQPCYIHLADGAVFGMAGVYEHWQDADGNELDSCTILTAPANEAVRPLHERMPVILPRDRFDAWLDPRADDGRAAAELLGPIASERLTYYPVRRVVNNPKHDAADCIEPADDSQRLF